ncbi:hypothetical protein BC936DRAFT_143160 [Jimgerdemannia flammicorona]|uniref:Uncharacterized protein n=1 Tax=Jimgerdemannia flammicorona TaxID=994334 RepID=A0A433DEA9_9FUNG|nr:hypothetical protein BC936DRAFT_143160 [Jimgerdemannia flammicorona]
MFISNLLHGRFCRFDALRVSGPAVFIRRIEILFTKVPARLPFVPPHVYTMLSHSGGFLKFAMPGILRAFRLVSRPKFLYETPEHKSLLLASGTPKASR